jgi:hypothetical protein
VQVQYSSIHHTLYTHTTHPTCSGRYLVNVSLVDKLVVPPTTPAGAYVLQLRYDCEETAQVQCMAHTYDL